MFCCIFVSITISDFTLQTFKDHMIDGETLPLLSEEHLLDTLGLKLGPALKIRSQVESSCIYKSSYPIFEQQINLYLIKTVVESGSPFLHRCPDAWATCSIWWTCRSRLPPCRRHQGSPGTGHQRWAPPLTATARRWWRVQEIPMSWNPANTFRRQRTALLLLPAVRRPDGHRWFGLMQASTCTCGSFVYTIRNMRRFSFF